MITLIKSIWSNLFTHNKSWDSEWLAGKSANSLALGSESVNNAMSQSYIIYRCVKIIAETSPKAPIKLLYGDDELQPENPIYNLFQSPFENTTYYDLISQTAMFYALYGEAYWFMNKSIGQSLGISKIPAEIIVLDPRAMKPVFNDNKTLKGWLFNNKIALELEEVVQFKSNNPYNPYRGLSPLDSVKFEINTDYKASQFQLKFFENGAIPGTVLTTDPEDTSTDSQLRKIAKMWDKNHKSVSKSSKTAVLRGGVKIDPIGLSQREMSFIESRIMTRDIILNTLGVPKAVFGATENINRATAEVHDKVFWETTIQPLLLRMQYKINTDILKFIGPGYTCQFDFTKIQALQNLYSEDVTSAHTLFSMGFSRNELNKRFDLGFDKDDENGDDKYITMSLQNLNEDFSFDKDMKIINTPEIKEVTQNTKINKNANQKRFLRYHKRLEKPFKKKIDSHFYMQKNKVLKYLTQSNKADEEITYEMLYGRINNLWENEDRVLEKNIKPLFQNVVESGQKYALTSIGVDRDVVLNNGLVLDKINKITGINNTVWKQIRKNLNEGINNSETIEQIADRIKNVYSMAKKRSITIARTEVTSSMAEATMQEYSANGIGMIEWLTAGDENVRETHINNGSIGPLPIGSTFPSGETFPSAVNCRCCISAVIQ